MLIRQLYTLILILVCPLFLLKLYSKKSGKPAFGSRWKEHWGITPKINGHKPIWIHAVSVGETIAATPIIKAIKEKSPHQAIVITTTTSTGAEQAERLSDLVEHRYMPIDFPLCIKGFLKAVKPKQLLIMETELWPNTLHTVANAGIPVTVLNARLSEQSCQRYAKFKSVFNMLSQHLSQILCQYPSDAERFIRLGLNKEAVHVTGSVKFDIEISSQHKSQGRVLREAIGIERPVWIACSTHSGEDEIILDAHKQLLTHFPDALLILVPRHPERFESVRLLSESQNFQTVSRTSQQAITADIQVYIADTMGEMLTLLASADICFMGGSLLGDKVGGHNLLEPAALKLPILNGLSYYNFLEITKKLLAQKAVILCENSDDIANNLAVLFKDSQLRQTMGQSAFEVVEQNRGALKRTLQFLEHRSVKK